MPNPQPPATRKPVVLMTMGAQPRNGHAYQVMTHKYIMPLVEISGCVPLLVPTCCGTTDLELYLDLADGVYLSGAGSNIDPALYGQENLTPEKQQDRDRDLFDLPLIKGALARGLPILGICRGMQEINVALGETSIRRSITSRVMTITGKMPTIRSTSSMGRAIRSNCCRAAGLPN